MRRAFRAPILVQVAKARVDLDQRVAPFVDFPLRNTARSKPPRFAMKSVLVDARQFRLRPFLLPCRHARHRTHREVPRRIDSRRGRSAILIRDRSGGSGELDRARCPHSFSAQSGSRGSRRVEGDSAWLRTICPDGKRADGAAARPTPAWRCRPRDTVARW